MDLTTFASALLLALEGLGTIRIDGSRTLERGLQAALNEARHHHLRIKINSLTQLTAPSISEIWEQQGLVEWCEVSCCWRLKNIDRESRIRDIRFCHLVRDAESRSVIIGSAVAFLNAVYAPSYEFSVA